MTQPFTDSLDVPAPGGSLRVAVAGAPAGGAAAVVLAVHGITASHRSWSAVARHLGDDVTVLAPDLRGRGDSSELPGPFGLDAHVTDLLAVLDHVGVSRAVVAGHSMGAYVAARLVAAAPDRVAAIALVDGGPVLPLPAGVDSDTLLAAVLGPALARLQMTFDSVAAYRTFWREHPAFAAPDAWTDDVVDYVDYDLASPAAGGVRSRVSDVAVRVDGRGILDVEASRAALGAVTCPATLLWAPRGLQDQPTPLLPAEAIAAARDLVPQLRVVEVPDTNHYVMAFRERETLLIAEEIRRLAGVVKRRPG